ncbi:MAG TPA: hypothetical protein VH702_02560 [Vicinamibacterales bacterium]|jgi:hypothetical protein
MKTIRLLLVLTLVSFCPARAYALEGWWDWLDALSGPGPYWGFGLSHTFCVPGVGASGQTSCWKETRTDRFEQRLETRVSWLVWDPGGRFEDDPADRGSANVWALDGLYLFRLGGRFQVDVGTGMGLMRFFGRDQTGNEKFEAIYRFTITPVSFSFAPFATKDGDWFRLRLDSTYVPQGFEGRDFGNLVTTFRTSGEFLTRMAIVIRY